VYFARIPVDARHAPAHEVYPRAAQHVGDGMLLKWLSYSRFMQPDALDERIHSIDQHNLYRASPRLSRQPDCGLQAAVARADHENVCCAFHVPYLVYYVLLAEMLNRTVPHLCK
jgi:hypothetical protein